MRCVGARPQIWCKVLKIDVGQTWFWPNLFWTNLVLAQLLSAQRWPCPEIVGEKLFSASLALRSADPRNVN